MKLRRALILSFILRASTTHAHTVGLSESHFVVDGDTVRAEVELAASDADTLGDPTRWFSNGVHVQTDVGACIGRYRDMRPLGDGASFHADYACPAEARRWTVTLSFLSELPSAQHVARIERDGMTKQVAMNGEHHALSLELPGSPRRKRDFTVLVIVAGVIAACALAVALRRRF